MRRMRQQGLAVLCLVWTVHATKAQAWEAKDRYYPDGRIKQLWFPSNPSLRSKASPEENARAFLQSKAKALNITDDLSDLKLIERRQSILGTHFRFQQQLQDKAIEGAQVSLSVLKDGRIAQLSSSLASLPPMLQEMSAEISLDEAYDRAWTWLGIRGRLLEQPRDSLVFFKQGDEVRLAYRLELSATEPYGAWTIHVDAASGKILSIVDPRIYHRVPGTQDFKQASRARAGDRREAFAAFAAQRAALENITMSAARGSAQVFDPDPRTALARRDLSDTSAADLFIPAYVRRPLLDIQFDGSKYHLQGPWVQIIDFDPPTNPPSLSGDGQWNYERGNNAFNDAMTYFHIDQSQRYLQKLGYKDETGLQFAPIEVDTDGVNGADNSYFSPINNRLSFGHGCVDDNEDADVILHEYFHAIQHAINPAASGGDTGAMGEGFSDYWAASYSLSSAEGAAYYPQEIYSWDGHGEGDKCWPGRILNATAARYNPARTYPAHVGIEGGFQSDELWATPLFQSLLALKSRGIPREEVDRIIVEAQFGLGANITMPEMAQSIVVTAGLLYPGPHAEVFKNEFVKMGILEVPHPVLNMRLKQLADSGGDGAADPGETIELVMNAANSGTAAADDVTIELSSSDAQVEIIDAKASIGGLATGANADTMDKLSFKIDSAVACGASVNVTLTLRVAGVATLVQPYAFRLGQPQVLSARLEPMLPIPDNNQNGALSLMRLGAGGTVSDQFRVGVSIKHNYRGDLRVTLVSPGGKKVLLSDREGWSARDLEGIYPVTLVPKEPLSKLIGESRSGNWSLLVQDLAPTDTGTLQSWSIEDTASYICQ